MKNITGKLTLIACITGIASGCSVPIKKVSKQVGKQQAATFEQSLKDNQKLGQKKKPNKALSKKAHDFLAQPTQKKAKTPEKRFNLNVKDMSATQFFSALTHNTATNILVGPKVSGSITLNMKQTTIAEVMKAVESLYNYDITQTSYGYTVRVPKLETRVFTLNRLNIKRTGSSSMSINDQSNFKHTDQTKSKAQHANISDSSQLTTTFDTNHFWANLKSNIELIINANPNNFLTELKNISKNGNLNLLLNSKDKSKAKIDISLDHDAHHSKNQPSVTINPVTGIIVVHAYKDKLEKVAKYIKTINDVSNRQVIIEAKVIEVALNNDFKTGIDWNALHFNYLGASGTLSYFTQQQQTTPSYSHLNPASQKQVPFGGVLNMLAKQGKVQVLSSPRISTLNNQKAVIKVGTDELFVTGTDSTTIPIAGGTDVQTTSNIALQPYFNGISLDVTPEISANGDVTLHIHPIISQIEQKNIEVRLGHDNNVLNIPSAMSNIRESDTVVRAKSGQVIVLGGLMSSTVNRGKTTLPGLESLDIAPHNNDNSRQIELVILLKPTVIKSDSWDNELDQASKRFKAFDLK